MLWRKKIGLSLVVALLLSMTILPQAAQAEGVRVVGDVNFVVFLNDDDSLEYYEVINSQGHYIGFTPPGWRNDRLGRQLVDVQYRWDGARAELWHLSNDIYFVDFYRSNGSFIGSGSFSAAGIPGRQYAGYSPGYYPPSNPTYPTNPGYPNTNQNSAGTTTVNTTTSITTTGNNAVSTTTTVNITPTGGTGGSNVYVVQPGDTLFKIARRFGVSLYALASANGISNVNLIYVGQRLIIPY